jgi:hypothetical protein
MAETLSCPIRMASVKERNENTQNDGGAVSFFSQDALRRHDEYRSLVASFQQFHLDSERS